MTRHNLEMRTPLATVLLFAILAGACNGRITGVPAAGDPPGNPNNPPGNPPSDPPQNPPASAPHKVTWTKQTVNASYPGVSGYLSLHYDPVSRRIIVPSVPSTSNSIYVSEWDSYDPASNQFVVMNSDGTDARYLGCSSNTPTQPGNRHPYNQMVVDTVRNVFWLALGANQNCNADPTARRDTYRMTLQPDPTTSTWTRVLPTRYPSSQFASAMAHDPVNDVLLWYGGAADTHEVYCPSSGSLTAAQQEAGCTVANDWVHIRPENGVADVNGTSVTRVSGDSFLQISPQEDYIFVVDGFYMVASVESADHLTLGTSPPDGLRTNQPWFTQPAAVSATHLLYDSATQRMLLFGGTSQNGAFHSRDVWGYDVRGRKWKRRALSTTKPPEDCGTGTGLNTCQLAVAYRASDHIVFYHQNTGLGAPRDWVYDPTADTWSTITNVGGGETNIGGSVMAYSPACDCLVTYANNGGTGSPPVIWVGQISEL